MPRKAGAPPTWPADAIETVRALTASGYGTRAISGKLWRLHRFATTQNAVCGLINRERAKAPERWPEPKPQRGKRKAPPPSPPVTARPRTYGRFSKRSVTVERTPGGPKMGAGDTMTVSLSREPWADA